MNRIVAAAAVILGACASETTSLELTNTRVELDVFSGRPNPVWQLTAEEVGQLQSRLSKMARSNRAIPQSGLGYRGFVAHDGARRIAIGSGRIVVWEDDVSRVFEDKRGAEDWLRRIAVQRGYGPLIERN